MKVRVRFAPSPTGAMHLGNARAALFNWLFARHHGADGTFILRVEDTDRERSTDEATATLFRVMEWLGLDWDEGPKVGGEFGPYTQFERMDLYTKRLEELVSSGYAYECWCSAGVLEEDRQRAVDAGEAPIYAGRCRDLTEEQRAERRAELGSGVIRFKVPEGGTTTVVDVIHGETPFENDLLGDFVIARTDGVPVYNFACVVDDIDMQITHVIRGNDHLSNTPRQVLIYEALGGTPPLFAHAPMILGPDRQKLSKRHGASTVEALAEDGYLASAVRNYLALLGWSKDDETTVMTTDEIVESFDLSRVKKSPSVFDYDKLLWINGQHLRAITPEEFAAEFAAWRDRWCADSAEMGSSTGVWSVTPSQAAFLVQEKVDTFSAVGKMVDFLAEPHAMSDEAAERLQKAKHVEEVLDAAIARLSQIEDWTAPVIEGVLRALCEELEQKPRIVFAPIRFAATGRTITPGLFESIEVLGAERTLDRMKNARSKLTASANC